MDSATRFPGSRASARRSSAARLAGATVIAAGFVAFLLGVGFSAVRAAPTGGQGLPVEHAAEAQPRDLDVAETGTDVALHRTTAARPMLTGGGAPSEGYYTFIDSNEPANPPGVVPPEPEFDDIRFTGRALGLSDDSCQFVALDGETGGDDDLPPFVFTFHDVDYQEAYVCSNGLISFGTPYNAFFNQCPPVAGAIGGSIFAYWDDLNPSAFGDVFVEVKGDFPMRTLIVQWEQVSAFGEPADTVIVQARLQERSNDIEVEYFDVRSGAPDALAFTDGGELLVGSVEGDRVQRFQGTSFVGNHVRTRERGLIDPGGIAVGDAVPGDVGDLDGDGVDDLLVSSFETDEVIAYRGATGTPGLLNQGLPIATFIPAATGGLDGPRGLTYGPGDDLYVASFNTDQILRFDGATGAFVGVFASGGGLDGPDSPVFGPDGNLYVSSYNNDRIVRFDGAGALIDTFVAAGAGGLDGPRGIAFGRDGNLYVSSENTDEVLRYLGSNGAPLGATVRAGQDGLDAPRGLRFGPSIGGDADPDLYVAGFASDQVHVFDPVIRPAFGGAPAAPHGAVIGPSGELLVADLGSDSILRYSEATGTFLGTLVPSGSGGLDQPYDIAVSGGDIFVSSFGTDQVLRYNGTTGAFLGAFVTDNPLTIPDETGGLIDPRGLAFFGGDLYVTSADDTVKRYQGPGGGSPGSFVGDHVAAGSGGLVTPTDVLFAGGSLFVSSGGTNQILRYDAATGAFSGVHVAAGSGGLAVPQQLLGSYPGTGQFAVASSGSNTVLAFDQSTGAFLGVLVPAADAGLSLPIGVAAAGLGRLYVTGAASSNVYGEPATDIVTIDTGGDRSRGTSATVGLDGPGAGIGLQYACNPGSAIGSPIVDNDLVIRFDAPPPPGADLEVLYKRVDMECYNEGDPITFEIKVTNNGRFDATNVTVEDQVPPEIMVTGSSATKGSYDAGTGIWTIGSLARDEMATLEIFGTVGPNTAADHGRFIEEFVKADDPPLGRLRKPIDLAKGPDGNWYVSSFKTDQILRYDPAGNFIDVFVEDDPSTTLDETGGLAGPMGIEWEDGLLYVASFTSSQVLRYDGAGTFAGVFVDETALPFPDGLKAPNDLIFGPDDNLYVSSSTNSQVRRYDGATGTFQAIVAAANGDPIQPFPDSTLAQPHGLLFVPDVNGDTFDDLLVASQGTSEILIFSGNPAFETLLGRLVFGSNGGLSGPSHMTIGPEGDLFVSSSGGGAVLRYNIETGEFQYAHVPSGRAGLDQPHGLTFDGGQLYVASAGSNQILRFENEPSGALLSTVDSGRNRIRALTTTEDGGILLSAEPSATDARNLLVRRYVTADDSFVDDFIDETIGSIFCTVSEVYDLALVTIDEDNQRLYVALQFSCGVTAILIFGGPSDMDDPGMPIGTLVTSSAGLFSGPDLFTGLAVGDDDNLYVSRVAGSGVSRVERYRGSDGLFLGTFASTGLQQPWGLDFGADGNLYVADRFDNHVVQYEGGSGALLDLDFVGFGSGGLADPQGLLIGADDHLYVSSSANHQILRYRRTDGAFLGVFATIGVSAPDKLALAPNGDVYAANRGNGTIRRYDIGSAFIDVFAAVTEDGLNCGRYVAFGPDGNLYVTSEYSDDIKRYDGTTGAFIDVFVDDPQLDGPQDLEFGPDGDLYVASFNNDRVLRFDGTTGAFQDVVVPGPFSFIGPELDGPVGLAFGPIDGDLYVSNLSGNSVTRYLGPDAGFLAGAPYVTPFVDVGGSPSISSPRDIIFGPDLNGDVIGELLVSTPLGVLAYDGELGTHVSVFASDNGLSGPDGLAFGPDGNLYVVSTGTNEVMAFTPDPNTGIGIFAGIFIEHDPSDEALTQLEKPIGITFGPDGDVYVASCLGHNVLRYQGFIPNYAEISGQPNDPRPVNNIGSVGVVVKGADLTVTKTIDNRTPFDGDTVVYTVEAFNLGPEPVTMASVTETLDNGISIEAFSVDRGSFVTSTSQTGLWNIGALDVYTPSNQTGDMATLILTGTVDTGAFAMYDVVTNTVTIGAPDQGDPVVENNTATAPAFLTYADLVVQKSATPSEIREGEQVRFEIEIGNQGIVTATGVSVIDFLPLGLALSGVEPSSEYNPVTGMWDVGTLGYDPVSMTGVTRTLVLTGTALSGTGGMTLTNRAFVSATDLADPFDVDNPPNNNEATADVGILGADLAISKDVTPPPYIEGELLTFTLTVDNFGPEDAADVRVVDRLPEGLTHVSDNGGGDYTPGSGLWSIGDMAAGDQRSLTIVARLLPGYGGRDLRNTASVSSSTGDIDRSNNSDSVVVAAPSVDLRVSIVSRPAPLFGSDAGTAGAALSAVSIEERGESEAPSGEPRGGGFPGLELPTSGALGEGDGVPAPTVDAGTADAGASGSSKDVAVPSESTSTPGLRAWVASDGADSARASVRALASPAQIQAPPPPQFEWSGAAVAGHGLFYEVTVANVGIGLATGVELTATLAADVRYIADDLPQSCVEAPTGQLTCQLPDIPGGESVVVVIQTEVAPDAFIDRATASDPLVLPFSARAIADQPDLFLPDNLGRHRSLLTELADLSISKISKPDDAVRAGERATYTVRVENLGPSTAHDVVFTDTIVSSGAFTIDMVIDDPARQDACTIEALPAPQAGQMVVCRLDDNLEPVGSGLGSGRWSVQLEVTAVEDQDLNNEVRVFSGDGGKSIVGTPDPQLRNNVARDGLSVTDAVQLEIEGSVVGRVHDPTDCATVTETVGRVTAGDVVTWTWRVTNLAPAPDAAGGSRANDVIIEQALVDGLEPLEVTVDVPTSVGNCQLGQPGTGGLPARCVVDELGVGESAVMTVVARVASDFVGRSGTNRVQAGAEVRSAELDPDLSDNRSAVPVGVTEVADLTVSKTASSASIAAGQAVSFEIVVANAGPSDARNVIVRDTLPPEVRFTSARIEQLRDRESCTYVAGSHEVVCSLFDVPVGEPPVGQRRVFINTTVSEDAVPGPITNSVTVSSEQTPDCDPSNNTEITAGTIVDDVADLSITKSSAPTKVFAGEQKRYDIRVRNGGPSDAEDVVVYDVLPDEVAYEIDTNDPMCTSPSELIAMRAELSGANEVPPFGTDASGLATFVLNTDTNELTYAVQVADIDGIDGAAGIHIHRAPAGVNGPIVVSLFDAAPPPVSPAMPIVGVIELAPALAADIASAPGDFYVNVHTAAAPAGEVRGQLATATGAPLRCELGTLDVGGVRELSVWARVRPETPTGTTITNVAIVTSPTEPARPVDGTPSIYLEGANNVAASKNLVLGKSDLKIAKFGKNDGQVRAGEVLTYTVIVDNLGPSFAQDVSVKDVLQAGGRFDLIDVSVDRPAVCTTLAGGITNTVSLPASPWPVTDAPPPFGVLGPLGIEDIDQRLELDCTLVEGDDPATPDVNEAQLAVLTADGPPNAGRWILTVRVRASQAQDMDNVADVVSTYDDPDLSNNHAEVEHELSDVADLSVVKTVEGEVQVDGQVGVLYDMTGPAPSFPEAPSYVAQDGSVTAGRRIRYEIRVTNDGPSNAENVRLTDRLPAGVTLVPGTLSVVVDDVGPLPDGACQTGTPGDPIDRIVCGIGLLRGTDAVTQRGATVSFQVLVDPKTPPGAVLENDASVSSDVFDPDNADDHAHAQIVVDTAADLATQKLSVGQNVVGYDEVLQRFDIEELEDRVTAGLALRYAITVQNAGPSTSRGVTVREVLPGPDRVTLLGVEGARCRPDAISGNVLYCSVGDLAPGAQRTFDVYVTVDPAVADGFVLQNCATALSLGATPPAPPPPLTAPASPPDLPLTADPFDVDNTACASTTVNAVADVGGAGIQGGAQDRIVKRDVPARDDLDMAVEPDLAVAGDEHRYRVTFGNAGPSVATGVTISDTLDFKQPGIPGERFVACEPADPDDAVTCSYDPVANVVTVEEFLARGEAVISGGVGTLPPGIPFSFDIVTEVDPGYVLDASDGLSATVFNSEPGLIARNTVFIETTTLDFRPQNNRDTERTSVIAEADLTIEKSDVFGDFLTCDPVAPGGAITYTLSIANEGPSDAASVTVVDRLPADLLVVYPGDVTVTVSEGEVVEIRDDGRVTVTLGRDDNNKGDPELGRLNSGNSETIVISAFVRSDAQCGATVTNRAEVNTRRNDAMWPPAIIGPPEFVPLAPPRAPRTPTWDPDPTSNEATEDTTVECPAVAVNKTVSFDGTCPGQDVTVINDTAQPVTFCYEITNVGTTYLDTVRITDTIRMRSEPWPTVIYTDTLTFDDDPKVPLAPGDSVSRQVTIDPLTRQCGNVFNRVEVVANPVNSGRTDLSCLPDVSAFDTARIEVPCLGVDFRLQLPVIDTTECETWIQVQNVGDRETIPLVVMWGEPGSCPPQAAGPLKAECGGLLRPGSAWSFAADQMPLGARSAVVYSLSAEPVEDEPGQPVPFGLVLCDEVFLGVVGSDIDWLVFDTAYRERGTFNGRDFGEYQGEPLAVTVNRACPDPVDDTQTVHAAYSGISSDLEGAYDPDYGGYTFYAPFVLAEQGDLSSLLRMQNSGELCSSIEIWFKGQDNCLRPILGDVLQLSRGESITFDPRTVVGPGWIGSAWVRSTQPLGIVVDTFGPNHFTSYNGVPADVASLAFSLADQVNYVPLIYNELQGWDSAITVQNLSASVAAKVKVYFLDHGGAVKTTLVDWICPRGSQTFFLPVIENIPGGWVGSARIESQEWWSPGQPIADPPRVQSVVLLDRWSDPARTERREAVAYNAHTETIFDWQLARGKGGITTGSAVFALPMIAKANRGVTSEIAVTNLVPKPGSTNFALYLYDQNGLIDAVCQQLSEKQVEYIDVATWGWVNPSFLGSAVVSAVSWEHHVFNDEGEHVRNLVGLGGVVVERVGGSRGGSDVPGDESKAYEAFPIFDHFRPERPPMCP